jgi:hypothetical protein
MNPVARVTTTGSRRNVVTIRPLISPARAPKAIEMSTHSACCPTPPPKLMVRTAFVTAITPAADMSRPPTSTTKARPAAARARVRLALINVYLIWVGESAPGESDA